MAQYHQASFGRLVALAAVTGLKTTFGPALVAAAHRREHREALALAAMAEMIVDKLPITPSRSRFALLLPRALAGYWTAQQVARADGLNDPMAAPTGAAVAAVTATVAPAVRRMIGRTFGIPDPLMGVVEDALALYVGATAAGLSGDDLRELAEDALSELRQGRVGPAFKQFRGRVLPV